MAVAPNCTVSLTPAHYSSIPPRKYSAPSGPYRSVVSNPIPSYSHGNGSLLPMPPNYNEGSCWTLASLSSLNPTTHEIRSRIISVEVTKISLRTDGRWSQEKPYIIEKTWNEWLDFRERIVQRYPETEPVLPKLSKSHGFLESIFTNSRRGNSPQGLNVKELNNFLSRLVTKCSKKVINSSAVQNFFQTEEMRAGRYQVQYTDDDLPPLAKTRTVVDVPLRDEATSIASHLQAFRFPEPNAARSHTLSDVNLNAPHSNPPSWHHAVGSDGEMPAFNEKFSPRQRGKRPTDPMTVINERMPPPASAQESQITFLPSANERSLGHPRNPIRPNTAVIRTVPVSPLQRPTTSDSGRQHEAVLKHPVTNNYKPLSTSARRPSENLPGYSREANISNLKLARPQLREFKSMQDIRPTAGNMKTLGKSGRNGLVDFTRNNSVPIVGENKQIGTHVRSPTNHSRRHRRTPSDSSSSFGSSQFSPISSVLSSPTVTPSGSTNALLNSVSNQRTPNKIASRRSVDSLGTSSMIREDPIPSRLIDEHENGRSSSHQTVPPHILVPTRITTQKMPSIPPKPQRRPHTSAENVKLVLSNTLTLKVTHPESKTNIILPIQRGLCSLQQIKSKIQNKMKLAADIELNPDWKMKLAMIDQEEVVSRDELGNWKYTTDLMEDDGLKLVELVNVQSRGVSIKKITLRIF